jgi:hypothetical protein
MLGSSFTAGRAIRGEIIREKRGDADVQPIADTLQGVNGWGAKSSFYMAEKIGGHFAFQSQLFDAHTTADANLTDTVADEDGKFFAVIHVVFLR